MRCGSSKQNAHHQTSYSSSCLSHHCRQFMLLSPWSMCVIVSSLCVCCTKVTSGHGEFPSGRTFIFFSPWRRSTRWPYRKLSRLDVMVDLNIFGFAILFSPSFHFHSQCPPFSHSWFLSLCLSFYLAHSRDVSSLAVLSLVRYFAEVVLAGAPVYSHAQWASGDEGCGGDGAAGAGAGSGGVGVHIQTGGFSTNISTKGTVNFHLGSCETIKVWNMLQRVCLTARFIMTTMHRSQHHLSLVGVVKLVIMKKPLTCGDLYVRSSASSWETERGADT